MFGHQLLLYLCINSQVMSWMIIPILFHHYQNLHHVPVMPIIFCLIIVFCLFPHHHQHTQPPQNHHGLTFPSPPLTQAVYRQSPHISWLRLLLLPPSHPWPSNLTQYLFSHHESLPAFAFCILFSTRHVETHTDRSSFFPLPCLLPIIPSNQATLMQACPGWPQRILR